MSYRHRPRLWICRVPDWQLQAFAILLALFVSLLNAIPAYLEFFEFYFRR